MTIIREWSPALPMVTWCATCLGPVHLVEVDYFEELPGWRKVGVPEDLGGLAAQRYVPICGEGVLIMYNTGTLDLGLKRG